ncbi:NYN domain-containing protein [Peptoniphilus stercorisuis]|uniref:RNA-binding protein with PIN domain n=1 Tax=Peptoniphilus stercorisuis TaxID=1436965 RepID=A0ABS4KAN4_9FIRM|nr:NYN domain-containing protein [Peptoniphilus stercorisuis]MBP2024835.1 putative RNA-binding protein with PIN domain [Peptoniphilus stercorisuis]
MKKIYYKKDEKYLFVDGYNIINSWEKLKNLSSQNLEDTRQKLMDEMSEFAIFTGESVILVFDGYMVKKSPGAIYKYKGILVVYTKEFETADHFIEKELHEIGRLRQVRVATSDNVEQQMILSRGGTRISARELEIEVENVKNNINKKSVELKNSNQKINAIDDKTLEKLEKLKEKIN